MAEAALNVSPSRTVLQGKPRQKLHGVFTLKNEGDTPLEVSVEPEDWSGGIRGSRGAVNWLTVTPSRLTLRRNQQTRVKFTVRIPKDASGELRTQVFFTVAQTSDGGVAMRSRLGTIIYVGVEGTERIDGAITKVQAFYTASTPEVPRPDRLEVVMGIHNRGNAHIVPEGEVVIQDEASRVVETLRLQSGWGLLPNEEDTYRAIGHGIHLKPGRYTLTVAVFCGGDLHHPITRTKRLTVTVAPDGQLNVLDEEPAAPSAHAP